MPIYKDQGDKIISAGVLQGLEQDSARRRAEQDANLRRLLLGENVDRAKALAAEQGIPLNKANIQASESGFRVDPREPDMFKLMNMRRLEEEAADRKTAQLANKLNQANLGEQQGVLQGLKQSVESKGMALGPISASSSMPAWAVSIGERAGLAKEGATEQRQLLEAVKMFPRSKLFGATLTGQERSAFESALGSISTGTDEQKASAMNTLFTLYNKAQAGIGGGYSPEIKRRYEDQGGIPLGPIQSPVLRQTASQPPQGDTQVDPRRARLDELRAKYKK